MRHRKTAAAVVLLILGIVFSPMSSRAERLEELFAVANWFRGLGTNDGVASSAEETVSSEESDDRKQSATSNDEPTLRDPANTSIFGSAFQFAFFQSRSFQPRVYNEDTDRRLRSSVDEDDEEDSRRLRVSIEDKIEIPRYIPAPTPTEAIAETEPSVRLQRRSPITIDPHVRGYHVAQIYSHSEGAFWLPARLDLDTVMGKLDPNLVGGIRVVDGPYAVNYGPGFSFIDVDLRGTPRYDYGVETHMRVGVNYRENGDQIYGYDTIYAGDENWGFIFSYGHRVGVDYDSGSGQKIPSGYNSRNFYTKIGYDINPCQTVEFSYLRLDQTDTEMAGQFFNTDFLGTDGFTLSLVDTAPAGPWNRLALETWHNRTRFNGSTPDRSESYFQVVQRVNLALSTGQSPLENPDFSGTTGGHVASTGGRATVTFGEVGEPRLMLGTDMRYVTQRIRENFILDDSTQIDSNLPRASLNDPGLFAELSLPISECLTTTIGSRVDYVRTNARASELLDSGGGPGSGSALPGQPDSLDQSDVLAAAFVDNVLILDDYRTLRFGYGYAERAPTLTERYADGAFLAVAQSGFSRVIGDPTLRKERLWQIDLGLDVETDCARVRLRGFHSWIKDYVTYRGNEITGLTGARLMRFTNADMATITGADASIEVDVNSRWTLFAGVTYLDGRDREVNAPIIGISPLEGRAGVRLHDETGGGVWGVELFARIVHRQNRLAPLRNIDSSGFIPLETFTPGFTVVHLRSYWNLGDEFSIIAGIENLFDENYLEHLDLRLQAGNGFLDAPALSPGVTPYFGVEWIY